MFGWRRIFGPENISNRIQAAKTVALVCSIGNRVALIAPVFKAIENDYQLHLPLPRHSSMYYEEQV